MTQSAGPRDRSVSEMMAAADAADERGDPIGAFAPRDARLTHDETRVFHALRKCVHDRARDFRRMRDAAREKMHLRAEYARHGVAPDAPAPDDHALMAYVDDLFDRGERGPAPADTPHVRTVSARADEWADFALFLDDLLVRRGDRDALSPDPKERHLPITDPGEIENPAIRAAWEDFVRSARGFRDDFGKSMQ